MNILIPDYTASPRQTKFHSSIAFETLYGGAAGGGKTKALCAEAITSAMEAPDTHVYIFRRTLKELKQSVFNELMTQLAPYQNIPEDKLPIRIAYNSQESIFKFSNGSFIQLAYLDTISDRYKYQSAEIHVLLIDELTHFLEDDYEYLKTRVRAGGNRRLRVMSATNPGNVGHGWVKERFITSKDPGVLYIPEQVYIDPDTAMSRIFIPATVDDNPDANFKTSYKQVLGAIKDEQLKKALLYGEWDVFEGQVFTEWDRHRHTYQKLPETLDINDCDKYIGFDWGWRDPAVATWLARAPENEFGVRHVYVYREIHENHHTPTWWAEEIANILKDEPVEYMVLPHDCFSSQQGNRTIASIFGDYDIPYVRADSMSHAAKIHRQTILHEYLADSDDGEPTLQFHATNAANCVRTIPDLPYSDTRPEEISDKANDHDYDSVTYALMVIDDQESWLVEPGQRGEMFPKTMVYGTEDGKTQSAGIDIRKLLEGKGERDWRVN